MQWDPTLASVSKIAAGGYDSYLRSFADSVRSFGHPVVIGFGHEMNAHWYSWGYRHLPAPTFVAAWRHIVTLFRSRHADNITWLWTLQADESGTGPIEAWWPGAKYVTWVGIDGYYYYPVQNLLQYLRQDHCRSAGSYRPASAAVRGCRRPPGRPGAEDPRPVRRDGAPYEHLREVVWFDIAQHSGVYHQDWRIEDNPAAATAFRRDASALTLARP